LKETKDGLPWTRILVEGAVIVVSILLAFSVDALWEESQEKEEVAALVELLEADLGRNISNLQAAEAGLDTATSQMRTLLSILDGSIPPPSGDTLRALIISPAGGANFQPITAAYDAAVGTQAWERIPTRVKVELAGFVNAFQGDMEGVVIQGYIELTQIMGRYGGLRAFIPPDIRVQLGFDAEGPTPDVDSLLADPDFEAWVTLSFIAQTNRRARIASWVERLTSLREALAAV